MADGAGWVDGRYARKAVVGEKTVASFCDEENATFRTSERDS